MVVVPGFCECGMRISVSAGPLAAIVRKIPAKPAFQIQNPIKLKFISKLLFVDGVHFPKCRAGNLVIYIRSGD